MRTKEFQDSLWGVYNNQFEGDRLVDWAHLYRTELEALVPSEGSDSIDTLVSLLPERNGVIDLLASWEGIKTNRARFDFFRCKGCGRQVGRPYLGSMRSYGEYIAVSASGFYYLYTHGFGDQSEIWDRASALLDEHFPECDISDHRRILPAVLGRCIDPLYEQPMYIGRKPFSNNCPGCGGHLFTGKTHNEIGVLLCATYKVHLALSAEDKERKIIDYLTEPR